MNHSDTLAVTSIMKCPTSNTSRMLRQLLQIFYSKLILEYPSKKQTFALPKLRSLSKLSWHFTVADISKTWVIQNLQSISATISHLTLSKSKFGLNHQRPSIICLQCQTVLRNNLKSCPNDNIKSLWENTSSGSNIQYEIYQNTKQVLTAVRTDNIQRIQHELSSQGAILSAGFKNSPPRLT